MKEETALEILRTKWEWTNISATNQNKLLNAAIKRLIE